ncbi:MAG: polysaccharide biosynthesis tyrosine autokinase [Actinobacteria bacterium]|nr:polysaccharide biosynthesis tyrosine autokinase [Actinomycetota bacterium]
MPPPETTSQLGLRDYLRVARQRKWGIALVTATVTVAALSLSLLQTPVYQSTARLLVTQDRSSVFDPVTGQRSFPERAVQGEILVLQSEPVRSEVHRRLGSAPEVSATAIPDADGIEVVARSHDPEWAVRVADAYANSYIEFRRAQAVASLLGPGEEIRERIAELQAELDELDTRIEASRSAEVTPGDGGLVARRDSLVEQQALFKRKLDELQVDASVKGSETLLLASASAPTSPVSPRPLRDGVLAAVVGLLLGVGLAFLREQLDDTLRTKEDVDAAAAPLPVLGLVPAVPGWKNRSRPVVVSLSEPSSPVAESYRSLRTAIQFTGFDRPLRVLQVTSPSSSEGKTTTLANLAVALARSGHSVVAVCCDLRRPRLHDFFGLSNSVGFTSVLMGEVDLAQAVQAVPGVERLAVLASGPNPPNPSELLASRRSADVFANLQAHADIVLVDCPPVLPVTDAAVLAGVADATMLVGTAGVTRRRDLSRAIELLRQVDAPLVGVALNGVTEEGAYGYGYGYTSPQSGPSARSPFSMSVLDER